MTRLTDRIFGLVTILVAFMYIMSATQIQASFLSDPVGSKTFPIIVAVVAVICGGVMILRPDAEPDWPEGYTLLSIAISVALLIGYSYALKPVGFLIPTAVVAGAISYQISPRPRFAALAGSASRLGCSCCSSLSWGLACLVYQKGWVSKWISFQTSRWALRSLSRLGRFSLL